MENTPEILIDYSQFLQNAMRNAIRELLKNIENNGLPGEHHFYINFSTQHSQAIVSPELKREYPEEMSIVLQHQFWNLKVQENGFNVQLGFGNKTETIFVPFDAMLSFNDPIAHFGLQFQPQENQQQELKHPDIQKQNTANHTITKKNNTQNNITKFPKKQTEIITLKSKPKNENKNKKINKKSNNVVTLDKFRNAKE